MQSVMDLLFNGCALYNENRYEEAGSLFLEAITKEPTNLYALAMLTVVFLKTDKLSNAVELLKVMNRFIPDYGLTRYLNNLLKGVEVKSADDEGYRGFLDHQSVKQLYATYSSELYRRPIYSDHDLHFRSVTNHVEADFLYFFVRHFRPKNVIEFSPFEGLSTVILYEALRANNEPFSFATFDLQEFEGFTRRMQRYGIDLRVNTGDALKTVPQYLKKKDLLGKIDLCFVDSEHSYEFAKGYCREVFPLLGEDCILVFHDMCYCPSKITDPFDHYGPVDPSEIVGHYSSYGEGKAVSEYFSQKGGYKIFLTHKLFGGFGLLSPKLPINQALIEDLTKEIRGFFYKRQKSPSGQDRRIPTIMIAIPERMLKLSDYLV